MVRLPSANCGTAINLNLHNGDALQMRVAIFTSCTTDEITVDGKTQTVPGGPGLYSSLTARALGLDVDLYAGVDGNIRTILGDAGVVMMGEDAKTLPMFSLDVSNGTRKIRLVNSCQQVRYTPGTSSVDAAIVTPVYDEIAPETFEAVKSDAGFVFLDPQGFLRRADGQGAISLARTDVSVDGVSAIKVDDDELAALTGGDDATLLSGAGIDHVLHTAGKNIRMLSGGRRYMLALPNRKIGDTTGVGDIFSAAFCCTMLKEKDLLWAFCFACGAANAALDTHKTGIQKVPSRRKIETSAAYFYNTVEFGSI